MCFPSHNFMRIWHCSPILRPHKTAPKDALLKEPTPPIPAPTWFYCTVPMFTSSTWLSFNASPFTCSSSALEWQLLPPREAFTANKIHNWHNIYSTAKPLDVQGDLLMLLLCSSITQTIPYFNPFQGKITKLLPSAVSCLRPEKSH